MHAMEVTRRTYRLKSRRSYRGERISKGSGLRSLSLLPTRVAGPCRSGCHGNRVRLAMSGHDDAKSVGAHRGVNWMLHSKGRPLDTLRRSTRLLSCVSAGVVARWISSAPANAEETRLHRITLVFYMAARRVEQIPVDRFPRHKQSHKTHASLRPTQLQNDEISLPGRRGAPTGTSTGIRGD